MCFLPPHWCLEIMKCRNYLLDLPTESRKKKSLGGKSCIIMDMFLEIRKNSIDDVKMSDFDGKLKLLKLGGHF